MFNVICCNTETKQKTTFAKCDSINHALRIQKHMNALNNFAAKTTGKAIKIAYFVIRKGA